MKSVKRLAAIEDPDAKYVPAHGVAGGRVSIKGIAAHATHHIQFPVILKVGESTVCLNREGVKELVKILLETL